MGSFFAKRKTKVVPPAAVSPDGQTNVSRGRRVIDANGIRPGRTTDVAEPDLPLSLDPAPLPTGPSRTGDIALGCFLVGQAALATTDQLAQATAKAQAEGIPLDVAAIALGLFTAEQLVAALSGTCLVPRLTADGYRIRAKALATISRADAEHFGVFPVERFGSLLTLAMVNPLDAEAIAALESRTGLTIKPLVTTRAWIDGAVAIYHAQHVPAADETITFIAEPSAATEPPAHLVVPEIDVDDECLTPAITPAYLPAVSLVPVAFRPADPGGSAQVVQRWVSLHSRLRIVNAVAVEPGLSTLLEGIPRRVA